MSGWHDWFLVAWFWFEVAIRIAAVVWVPKNRRPESAIAWLLLILVVPVPGLIALLLLGSARVTPIRRRRQRAMNQRIAECIAVMDAAPDERPALQGIARMNRTLGSFPLVAGNRVDLLPDPAGTMHAIAAEIDRAERFVHLEFYITAEDDETRPVLDAVRRATARGVRVRLLMDHLASRGYPRFRRLRRDLTRAGVEWHLMLPFRPLRGQVRRPDLRNHRKLVVVDGRVAIAGSQNLIDRRYDVRKNRKTGYSWLDLMARFEGPVVAELDAVFAADWYSETNEQLPVGLDAAAVHTVGSTACQVVPSGPGFDDANGLRMFVALLHTAERRAALVSPYFIPDETMRSALTAAALRGVEVELFVCEVGDHVLTWHAQRSYYEELLRAGVRIHAHRAPTILHAKHLTIDDDLAVIGSSNLDLRSFRLNFELSVLMRDRAVVDAVRAVEDSYRAASTEIELDEWVRRPVRARVVDHAARLTSGLQ